MCGRANNRGLGPIRQMQRAVDDPAVQRLVQSNLAGPEAESGNATVSGFSHDFSRIPMLAKGPLGNPPGGARPRCQMQSSLKLGQPNDKYEQEAERVADHVMRMPLADDAAKRPGALAAAEHASLDRGAVQAKAISNGTCPSAPKNGQEEEPDQVLQGKEQEGGLSDVGQQFSTGLQQSSTGGHELPTRTRRDMEARFGHSFGGVRVHTDPQAIEMTRQLNAEAFATGNHIYVNAGRYNPDSFSGKRLLAHELTHVLQQRSSNEKMVGPMQISTVRPATLQGYKLSGFPAAEKAQMHTAIATAISTVSSCSYLTWLGKLLIKSALRNMRYDYVPDLGLCGWTFPASWYIEVGKSAFDHSKCCDLAATLAHEASHTEWYTEGRARKMECECFNCSC